MNSKVIIHRFICISTALFCSASAGVFLGEPLASSPVVAQGESKASQQSEKRVVNVGVMAIRGVEQTQDKWQPTLDYLNETVPGYQFRLVPLTFESMEETIANGHIDFVLPNPGMYVELEWVHGARRIATLKNLRLGKAYTEFGAVIFRRRDRPDIATVPDLKGKRFMAVSEIAFGGWQMAWAALEDEGFEPYEELRSLEFAGSHDDVVYAVRDGEVDAGTVRTDTLERMAAEGRINLDDFVVLNQQEQYAETFPFALSTDLYPEWPMAVMPGTPDGLAEVVAIALMKIPADHPAAIAGQYQGWTIPENYQPVHETLRELRVRPYENWGKESLAQILYRYRYWLLLLSFGCISMGCGAVYLVERKRVEQALRITNEDLEKRVDQRTRELSLARDAAESANRAKSEFLAHMSHELRTPLNGILGYAQILQRDTSASTNQQRGINIIHQCGTHLLTLINDILDLSKIEAKKLTLCADDFLLAPFLHEIVEVFRIKAEQKDISFNYIPSANLPPSIQADEKRLRQVLLNIIGNAVKFTDAGGVTFRVETLSAPEPMEINDAEAELTGDGIRNWKWKLRFTVEDTGIGISTEKIDHIFLPFEQASDYERNSEGTGLGLAITVKILKIMGSELKVESTLGQGSIFSFEVEFLEAQSWIGSEASQTKTADIIGYKGGARHILVVDDRWENRSVVRNLLEPIGFVIHEADNGAIALEKIAQREPDMIVTDLVMPVLDGFEMTRQIRQRPELDNIVILASSASVFSMDQEASQRAGCNDFLPKPISADALFDKLQQLLGIQWHYDEIGQDAEATETEGTPTEASEQDESFLDKIDPPSEFLEEIVDLVNKGDLNGVRVIAETFGQENFQYRPLTKLIAQKADEFEDDEILNIIQRYQAQPAGDL